jgi:hypothetical protein
MGFMVMCVAVVAAIVACLGNSKQMVLLVTLALVWWAMTFAARIVIARTHCRFTMVTAFVVGVMFV